MKNCVLRELEGVIPYFGRSRNMSLEVIYLLVREHMGEIEEARASGYSWRQIDRACFRAWSENDGPASSILWWNDGLMIKQCYYHEKKSSAARSVEARTR